ncbi:MAG: hypothetical protein VW443_11805 [Pseudomonadales bacterium]
MSKVNFYERIGDVESVTCLTVMNYDERHGFTHISHRYAPEDETETVQNVLLSHVPERVSSSENFTLSVIAGRTELKGQGSGLDEISLGLSND